MFTRHFNASVLRGVRGLSSGAGGLVTTTRCGKNNNIFRVAMNGAPVNSLSLELMVDLRKALQAATTDEECHGVVLGSSCRTFSAGLNMKELHGATPDHLVKFWTELQDMMYLLYGMKQAVVCEINGHAPAAGTILALCCDSRVAAPGVVVGLNESAFGLNVPHFGIKLMQDTMGLRVAYRAISLGTLFQSEEALKLGFVDVLTESADPALVQQKAIEECEKWVATPGREGNKLNLRSQTHAQFVAERQKDIDAFVSNLTEPVTQQRLGDYLASLSKKK